MKTISIAVSKRTQERIKRNRKATFNTWKNVNFSKELLGCNFYLDYERIQNK